MFSKCIDFAIALSAICQLKAGPGKLPFSIPILTAAFILYIVARFAEGLFERPPFEASLLALIDAVLLALIAAAPLWLLGLGSRITQTLTALMSAGIVVSVASIFLTSLLMGVSLSPSPDQVGRIIAFITFPLVLWRLLLNTTLIRLSLSWPFSYGFILALIHLGIVMLLGSTMPEALGK